MKTVNYLDVTFNLNSGTYYPYRKPNDQPLYINTKSNHPPRIIKQLPDNISRRISNLSCNETEFNKTKPIYENALKSCGLTHTLTYNNQGPPTRTRKNVHVQARTRTSTLRKKKTPEQKEDNEKDLIYIKMPFINEDLKRQTQAVIKRTGISNTRVYYVNGRTSASVFKAPKDKQLCPDNCDTCSAAKVAKRCLVKNCVDKIDCRHCHLIYIGESSRTIGSRLKEHMLLRKQLNV